MYHSVVKVQKNCRPEFFIYNIVCLLASNNMCFFQKVNKNTLGIQKYEANQKREFEKNSGIHASSCMQAHKKVYNENERKKEEKTTDL